MRRVILVRPSGPRNVGTALRAVANFGPAELYVVAPEHRSLLIHPEFEQMAHGVKDYQSRCIVVDTFDQALADCTYTVAFTARRRDHLVVRDWREVREDVARRGAAAEQCVGLVFGTEVHGLVHKDLERVNLLACLPTSGEHGSINLGVSTALILFDTFLPTSAPAGSDGSTPLDGRHREYLKEHVAETLAGHARSDSIERDIASSVRRLFARADLETRDARAWHAVMRALGNTKQPRDYGLDARAELE